MNLRRSLFTTMFLVVCSASAGAAEIRFGSLQVDWPEGFVSISSKPPFELNGPSGEKVLVTVMRPGKDVAPELLAAEVERMAQFGEGLLRKQGEKAGKLTIPLTRSFQSNGDIIIFAGSETSNLFSAGYFLQYLVVSQMARLAFFTIEGKGNLTEQHSKYLPIINASKWTP